MNSIRHGSSFFARCAKRHGMAGVSLLLLALGLASAASAQSGPYSQRSGRQESVQQEISGGKGLAEKRLGQGVSYYYEGRYALSSKLIREALALKLAHPADEAMAHQYLAFFYCLHDLADQCEQEFRLALSGPMPIELSSSERDNPAWREIYARVRSQTYGLPSGNVARGRFGGRIEEIHDHDPNSAPIGQVVNWGKSNDRFAARLRLAVEPWGDVYINQQKVATSPPVKEVTLSPGIYTIEIRNAELPAFVQTIALKAQTSYRLIYQFDPNQ